MQAGFFLISKVFSTIIVITATATATTWIKNTKGVAFCILLSIGIHNSHIAISQ